MVPPVARLGTRWASRSTAPARGKQPGLSQGGPRRSQNRSPPAVAPLWLGLALRAQCGFALAPPEAGKGPRAFANSPERYSPGGDSFAMCLRLRPGCSRGARRVWRRGSAPPLRRDRPDLPTHHVQIPKREPPWGKSSCKPKWNGWAISHHNPRRFEENRPQKSPRSAPARFECFTSA